MKYVLCSGGLGNQMFQYSFYKALQDKYNDVTFDISYFDSIKCHSGYRLEEAFLIKDGENYINHFSFVYRMIYKLSRQFPRLGKKLKVYYETPNTPILLNQKLNTDAILFGYWQGENACKITIQKAKELFQFKNISTDVRKIANKMSEEVSVIIHIRRGDYLNHSEYVNLGETKYYENAISYVTSKYKEIKFYVISDDIQWCKTSRLFNEKTEFVENKKDYEDLYLLSSAKICILANSTFSWWGGYLGNHDMVIRPSKYFKEWSRKEDELMFPNYWKKIEVL